MKKKSLEGERCDFCEVGALEYKTVREIYRKKNDIVIIDDVPTFACSHCGERYYLPEVSKKMRQIAENQKSILNRISVPLAEYNNRINNRG